MENSFSNIQDFWETSSSNNGAVLTGNPNESLINSSQVKENKLYDILEHERQAHLPSSVFSLKNSLEIFFKYEDCLDMPIRLAGQEQYGIPRQWSSLIPVIQKVIDIEHSNNPFWKSYNTYLTVQYNEDMKAGIQQRNPGAHTDGLQSVRHGQAVLPARNYVSVTNGGNVILSTDFCG